MSNGVREDWLNKLSVDSRVLRGRDLEGNRTFLTREQRPPLSSWSAWCPNSTPLDAS